jgi:hypothetical protein
MGLLLALILTVALSSIATLRARSFVWLLAFVLALQALLHGVLVVGGSGSHVGGGHGSLFPSGSLLLGHIVASVVAALVLKFGDGLLDRWAALLGTAFGSLFILPVLPVRACALVAAPSAHPILTFALHSAPRRGPPALGF